MQFVEVDELGEAALGPAARQPDLLPGKLLIQVGVGIGDVGMPPACMA